MRASPVVVDVFDLNQAPSDTLFGRSDSQDIIFTSIDTVYSLKVTTTLTRLDIVNHLPRRQVSPLVSVWIP